MWWREAACRDAPDPDVFFPEHAQGCNLSKDCIPACSARSLVVAALSFCDRCPVKQACLDWCNDFEEGRGIYQFCGIWGGSTPRQRSRVRAEGRVAQLTLGVVA